VLLKKKGTKRKPKKARHRPKNAFDLPHGQNKTHFSSLLFSYIPFSSYPISCFFFFFSLRDNNNEEKKKTLLHTSFSFSPSAHQHQHRHQQHTLTFPPSHAAPIRAEVV